VIRKNLSDYATHDKTIPHMLLQDNSFFKGYYNFLCHKKDASRFFSNDASFLSAMGCRPFGGASLEAPEHPARVKGYPPLQTPVG
jgi:hypothetical protein